MTQSTITPDTIQQPVATAEHAITNETDTTATTNDMPDIETLLAEAEQRGYLRGRNEAIEQYMTLQGDSDTPLNVIPIDDDHDLLIFEAFPHSIWD